MKPEPETDAFELFLDAIRRNKFMPTPPPERNFVTPEKTDFIGQGIDLQLRPLVRHGLRPEHSLLELGSGLGRLALPLTQYLTSNYLGLDSNLSGVAWCHENITQRYDNFEFAVINAKNVHYKHRAEYGQESALQADWPIPPRFKFDFACAYSLYTHLVWDEAQHYLAETARHLKPNGRIISTWFLIDEQSEANVRAGKAHRDFDLDKPGPMYVFRDAKEYFKAMAYDLDAVRDCADRAGLDIVAMERGGWSNRGVDQDLLVMRARN